MGNDVLKDVNSDQQLGGLQTNLDIDRDTAMRLGLTLSAIDNTLYDAFGQRQVSTIYNALNQYHVVMEVAPRYWQDPRMLQPDLRLDLRRQSDRRPADRTRGRQLHVHRPGRRAPRRRSRPIRRAISRPTRSPRAAIRPPRPALRSRRAVETMVPLSAFAKFAPGHTPLSVNHQGQFAASTISFNLAPGRSLSEAKTEIDNAIVRIDMPSTVRGAFAGTAATFQQSQSSMPLLFGGGAGDDLYRARHSLREPDPSDHHPLDPVLGQRRRGAGAVGVRHRSSPSSPRSASSCSSAS